MKDIRTRLALSAITLVLAIALALASCSPSGTTTAPASSPSSAPTVVPAPAPAPSPPPPPVSTTIPAAPPASSAAAVTTATPALTPSLVPTPTRTASQTPTITATPTPTAPAEVTVNSDRAVIDFPNKITFAIEATSVLPVKTLHLEYGSNRRSFASETNRVEPQYSPGQKITTNWSWEMKKTGSIPPGAVIWWQWRIVDNAGRTMVTPRQTVKYDDPRLQWQVQSLPMIDIYYSSQSASFIQDLTSGLASKLTRVDLQVKIPADRKPKIYIYPSSQLMFGAWLFLQEWTGAFAVPWYNTILIPVTSANLDWAKGTIAHETTHLLVGEAVFGPFDDIPTWLNEGLAEYSEGEMPARYRTILNTAAKQGKLISVRSLSGSFPAAGDQASLAYAESSSVVAYLIDTYGWGKMRTLLATFKDGATYDGALKKVYGFDMSGLEKEWRAKIGAT